jgi:hypothetical protein
LEACLAASLFWLFYMHATATQWTLPSAFSVLYVWTTTSTSLDGTTPNVWCYHFSRYVPSHECALIRTCPRTTAHEMIEIWSKTFHWLMQTMNTQYMRLPSLISASSRVFMFTGEAVIFTDHDRPCRLFDFSPVCRGTRTTIWYCSPSPAGLFLNESSRPLLNGPTVHGRAILNG